MRARNGLQTARLVASLLFSILPLPAHAAPPLDKQRTVPVEKRVRDLVSRMTLEEKARQLDMYAGADLVDRVNGTHAAPGTGLNPNLEKTLGGLGVGSIHDLYPDAALYNEIQRWVIGHSRLGIPAIFIEEGLHGFSNSFQGGTVFPQSVNLASTWNPDLARQTGAIIGAEARASGVDMLLGPVLDVAREPRWGRVEEDFGEDPYLTGTLGAAYVHGMQGESLNTDHTAIAEPKHFAAHGSPEGGLNTAPVHAGEREVRTVMLRSFEPALRRGGAMGVMAAYHEIDGIPCADNPWLLTTVLRQEWGFQGFVLSDLGAIQLLYSAHHVAATPEAAVREALTAGVDMQFYDFGHDTYQNAIVNGVREGKLPLAVVDRAVSRVLRVKFLLGLFDHPFVDGTLASRVMRSPEHLAVALQSARQSLCLLKNENHLLPLSRSLKRIAVIGPNAVSVQLGDYAQPGPNATLISPLDGIKAVVSPGTEIVPDEGSNIGAAVAKVKGADVAILVLGEHQGISGEGFDRSSLDLPGNQEALLEAVAATGVPVVLVLENGRPLTIPWAAAHVPAILEAWYPGERGGQVVAETLFGDNNPSGHLSISFPRAVGELPDFYNHDPSKANRYIDADPSPLYPFGHGLSYTTFRYDHLTATPTAAGAPVDVRVSVDVTNTGTRAGDEVVQLYLHHDTASVETPDRALKGFSRVSLRPGETRTVTFHLTPYELEVWNTQKQWAVEEGGDTVTVGGSSVGGLSTQFSLKPIVRPGPDGVIRLAPTDAALHGTQIRVAEELGHDLIGYWDNPAESASWTIRVPARALYRVVAECSTGHGPTAFDVSVAGQKVTSGTVSTSGYNDYKTMALGTVRITRPGRYVLTVGARDPAKWGAMNIRSLTLRPGK